MIHIEPVTTPPRPTFAAYLVVGEERYYLITFNPGASYRQDYTSLREFIESWNEKAKNIGTGIFVAGDAIAMCEDIEAGALNTEKWPCYMEFLVLKHKHIMNQGEALATAKRAYLEETTNENKQGAS